jgi:hypothetical protein
VLICKKLKWRPLLHEWIWIVCVLQYISILLLQNLRNVCGRSIKLIQFVVCICRYGSSKLHAGNRGLDFCLVLKPFCVSDASQWLPESFLSGPLFYLPFYSTYLRGICYAKFTLKLAVEIISFYIEFDVFTAVTMKNAVFWDVPPCRSCVNRRCGCWLQPPALPGFSFADFSTLKMETILSSETSVHIRYTLRHIQGRRHSS